MTRQEEWRKIILSINDNTFFDLMRNYLGKIQTPFNKQDLMDRLTNFLSREEIQERILSLIDQEDAELLSALSLSSGATESQLRHFFPDWTYLELLNRIRNLEERFLIYRLKGYCSITPLFEEKLKRTVISPSLLIKAEEVQHGFEPLLWFNDPLMLALYSFLGADGDLIKIDGSVKKRGSLKLEQFFPTLFTGEDGLRRFDLALKILINLNLIENDEGNISLIHREWTALSQKKSIERYSLYYGAALAESSHKTGAMTEFFSLFYNNFPRNKAIENGSLASFFILYCGGGPGLRAETVRDKLALLGILVHSGKGVKLNGLLNLEKTAEQHDEAPLIVQPNFEVTIKPFISMDRALETAGAMELKQYDLFSRYGLRKNSFLKSFNRGLYPEDLLANLESLSGKDIPQNIGISLKDWAEDHKKVTLYRGTVLKVSEDKRIVIEKTGYLDPYILETLAEGIYLLNSDFERQWTEALENLSITPQVIENHNPGVAVNRGINHSYGEVPIKINKISENWVNDSLSDLTVDPAVRESLLKKLNSLPIKGDEKKELEARINRKLIIHESQLNQGIVRPEINEARGMNFQGKVRLIESALQNASDRLELNYFANGDTVSVLVQPLELKREESERILNGTILPDEKPISLRVSKISRVRKIKSSLF